MDGRLQTIMAFAAATTAPGSQRCVRQGLSFHSKLLYLAIACFVVELIVGTYARLCGSVRLLNPATLYEKWLEWPPWEFKKNFIYWAGEDFKDNVALVKKKWALSVRGQHSFLSRGGSSRGVGGVLMPNLSARPRISRRRRWFSLFIAHLSFLPLWSFLYSSSIRRVGASGSQSKCTSGVPSDKQ